MTEEMEAQNTNGTESRAYTAKSGVEFAKSSSLRVLHVRMEEFQV